MIISLAINEPHNRIDYFYSGGEAWKVTDNSAVFGGKSRAPHAARRPLRARAGLGYHW